MSTCGGREGSPNILLLKRLRSSIFPITNQPTDAPAHPLHTPASRTTQGTLLSTQNVNPLPFTQLHHGNHLQRTNSNSKIPPDQARLNSNQTDPIYTIITDSRGSKKELPHLTHLFQLKIYSESYLAYRSVSPFFQDA